MQPFNTYWHLIDKVKQLRSKTQNIFCTPNNTIMIKNYLKITFRSLWKSKVFVLINILGLGIAIGCCIVAYLNYNFNANFDSHIQNVENIYRIDIDRIYQNQKMRNGYSPIPIGNAIKENIGDVDEVLRYVPSGSNFRLGTDLFNENITYVDPNFFEFFNFEIISGNPDILKDKSSVIISSEVADKYFPNGDALGNTIIQITDGAGVREYAIAGIFKKQPMNSSFQGVDMLTNINNYIEIVNIEEKETDMQHDWKYWSTTFVKVSDKSRISAIEERLNSNYIEVQNNARLDYKIENYALEPFVGMGQRAADDVIRGHWLHEALPPPAVYVPVIMGVLILLIACFNFTNTSMAIASRRLKEIGLRKVMGGLRQQLIIQFMLENLVLCFMALLAGLVFAAFLVPTYSNMWAFLDISLNFTENAGFYGFLVLVLLFTGLLAGSYPAFYISKFEPASILKGTSKVGKTGGVTNFLLVFQFAISLIAIVLGVVFIQNAQYQKTIDYGYNLTGSIAVYLESEDEFKAFENLVRSNPKIQAISGSESQINRSYRNDPVVNGDKQYDVDILHAGKNFFEVMDFKLLSGRGFRENSETDMKESVIVTEEMVKVFGWEEPLGQKLVWMDTVQLYVVGVMKDVYTNGLWSPLEPVMLRYVPESEYHFLTVRSSVEDLVEVDDFMKAKWVELFPDKMYTGSFMDNSLKNSNEINNNILKMFGFLGFVATFMSILGLFSIVSLNVLRRMKEVGVRKVLGASVPHLMMILNKKFIIILIVACTLGSTASYFLANGLMDTIWTYHVDPGITSFVISVALLIVMALSTTSLRVYKAATANPTETIRTE